MKLKKFILCESLIVVSICGAFALNIALKKEKVLSSDLHIAMDYYGSIDFEGDDTYEDNVWLDMVKEKYDFNCIIDYSLPTSQYETRTNTVIGSGNIPDAFNININQFSTLVKADLIFDDLSSSFDKYASDDLKNALGWDNNLKQNSPSFKKWCVDGKLKAIPLTTTTIANTWVMFIRKDWLNQINEDTPKTIEDVEIVLQKFQENNLGMGLALNKDILYTNAGSADFVFNAYGAYPSLFVNDENNKVDFGFLQNNVKDALTTLKRWYSKGYIYSEFATTDSDIVGQKCANGTIGMIYGVVSIPLWKLASCVSSIQGSDWIVAKAPSLDESTNTTVGVGSTGSVAYVVKKGYSNPERVIQMMNMYYECMYGMTGDFERFNKISELFPFTIEPNDKNYYRAQEVKDALDSDRKDIAFNTFDVNDTTNNQHLKYFSLNTESKYYYRQVRDYFVNGVSADARNWAYTRIFYGYEDPNGLTMADGVTKGYDSCFTAIDYYVKNDLIKTTAYDGVDTETYSKQRRTIESNISQMLKYIIIGERPLNYFDTTVESLRKGTAKTIIDEINSVLASE